MKISFVELADIRFLAAPALPRCRDAVNRPEGIRASLGLKTLLIGLLLSSLLPGQITPDTTSVSQPYSNSAPLPWPHTMSACANGALVVGVGQNTGYNVASVTYNGVSLKPSVSSVNSSTGNAASFWYLVNPPAGTHNIVVTLGGNSGGGLGTDWGTSSSLSFCGVDPVAPINITHAGSGPTTSHPTNTITPTVAGSYVVELLDITYSTSAVFTPSTGWSPPLIPKGGSRAVITYTGPVAAAPVANTWTVDSNYPYADVMLALTPFTAAAPPPPLLTPTYGTGPLAQRPTKCQAGQLWFSTDKTSVDVPLNITFCKVPGDPGVWSDPPPVASGPAVGGTLVAGVCSEAPWMDMAWTPCTVPVPAGSFYATTRRVVQDASGQWSYAYSDNGKRTVTGKCATAPPMNCTLP